MMLDEFLSDLYGNELSDMNIGNRNSREEPKAKLYPLIVRALNQARAKWRIPESLNWETITLSADNKYYELAASDVLHIVSVTNPYGRVLEEHEVRLNGSTLYFPCPQVIDLEVEYKQKQERWALDVDESAQAIYLPELLVPWLSSFVAAQYYLGQTDEAKQAKGATLLSLATTYANLFDATNTTNESTNPDTTKLCARGFA